jgi:hypothetical protein
MNEIVVTSNKLTNWLVGTVTSGLGPIWSAGCKLYNAEVKKSTNQETRPWLDLAESVFGGSL